MLGEDPTQLLFQQGERIEGEVCSHSVQLGKKIRKIGRRMHRVEFGILSAMRAVEWEMEGWEVSL